jgi:hypothetical protein
MSKGQWANPKPAAIKRLIRAIKAEGLSISQVRISLDGQIVVDTRPPGPDQAAEGQPVVL